MISIESQALSVVVGGMNTAKGEVGLQYKGLMVGGTVEENKTDYRSCLDALGKYNGKVGECARIHDSKK